MADRQRTRDIFGNSLLTFQGKPRQRFGPSISARGDRVGLGTECPTLRRHRVNPFRFQGAPRWPPPCVAIAAGLYELSKSRALRPAGGNPNRDANPELTLRFASGMPRSQAYRAKGTFGLASFWAHLAACRT